jgi:hypothetical protein
VITVFRGSDQRNGEAYCERSGHGGGVGWPGCGEERPTGCGIGVSKVRYNSSIGLCEMWLLGGSSALWSEFSMAIVGSV